MEKTKNVVVGRRRKFFVFESVESSNLLGSFASWHVADDFCRLLHERDGLVPFLADAEGARENFGFVPPGVSSSIRVNSFSGKNKGIKKMRKIKNVSVAEVVTPSVAVGKVSQPTDLKGALSLMSAQSIVFGVTESIKDACRDSVRSFIRLGALFSSLRSDRARSSAIAVVGYKDMYDYALQCFGFKPTSVKNFVSVYERFGDKDRPGCLLDRYSGYSFTQLVELLPVKDDLSGYKPDMTVVEIRDRKVLAKLRGAKADLGAYVRGCVSEAYAPFLSGLSVSSVDYDPKSMPSHWASRLFCSFSGSLSGKVLSGLVCFDPVAGCYDSCGFAFAGRDAPWQLAYVSGDSSEGFKSDVRDGFRKYADSLREGERSKAAARKAREDAKREKPEWQLWHGMDDASKRRSLSLGGVRDAELHPFFFSQYLYPDGGVVCASAQLCRFLQAFCTFAFDPDGKKVADKVIDVVYLWRGPAEEILSCHGSGDVSALVALLDS